MSIQDALVITILGMSVVFSGLILTAAMIWSFSLLPRLKELFSQEKTREGYELSSETVPADVMAVITAVLEVERRLYGESSPGVPMSYRREEGR